MICTPRLFSLRLSLALLSGFALADEPALLRVDWQPGKAYLLETTTHSSTDAGDAHQTMTVTQDTEMEVTPSANGGKDVRVTFTRLRGEMKGPGGGARFDTENPAASDPGLLETLGTSLGKAFILIYDEKNRFVDSLDIAGAVDSAAKVPVLSALADTKAAANLFRKSMEMGMPPIPVKEGDAWTADETLVFPRAGETHVKLSGKFASTEEIQGRKHAKITFDGTLNTTTAGKAKLPASFSITDKSTLSGVAFYDLERKVVSMSVSTTNLHLLVEGQPVKFEQKVTTRLNGVQDIRRAIPLEDDEALNKE